MFTFIVCKYFKVKSDELKAFMVFITMCFDFVLIALLLEGFGIIGT